MSGYLAGKCWQSALDPELKILAVCMADSADDNGNGIFSSKAYLAWKIGCSPRTVQRGLVQLRTLGIIVVIGSKQIGQARLPLYRMIESKLPKRTPWQEVRGDNLSYRNFTQRQTEHLGETFETFQGDIAVSPKTLVETRERREYRTRYQTPEFKQFWEAYPNKLDELEAFKAWVHIDQADKLLGEILAGVEAWKKTEQWKEGIKFIPNAAKFLRDRRWLKVPGAAQPSKSLSEQLKELMERVN